MKKIILIFISTFFVSSMYGQMHTNRSTMKGNIFTFSPLGLINKVKVKYERPLDDNVTLGSFAAWYYGFYPGVQIAPIVRYYFGNKSVNRFYLQAKVLFDYHNIRFSETTDPFFAVGGGFSIGYQFFASGDNFIALDIAIGLKLVIPASNISTGSSGAYGFGNIVDPELWWYVIGPGSVFDSLFSIGFAL